MEAEAGDNRLPLAFVTQLPGRLRQPQLPFGFEPILLVPAQDLSEREPNGVGLFRGRRVGGSGLLWLCWSGQGNAGRRNMHWFRGIPLGAGHRNRRWFHGIPFAGRGGRGWLCVCSHTFVISGSVCVEPPWRLRLGRAANKRGMNAPPGGDPTPGKQCSVSSYTLGRKQGRTRQIGINRLPACRN